MDDRRAGAILRMLRRRLQWRQRDLGGKAGVSQSAVSRAELGYLDSLSLRQLRAMFAALDARLVLEVRWRGGEVDRLLDEGHARLASAVIAELTALGWQVVPEATFMRLGERGSIDLLAFNPGTVAAAMFELKTEITSAEETLRRFDGKKRVVASVVEERFGRRPRMVGSFLVLSDTTRNRRRAASLGGLVGAAWPLGTRAVRRWLRRPSGAASGLWFVPPTHRWGSKRGGGGSHRVRRPRATED